jgi:hypothetical protein
VRLIAINTTIAILCYFHYEKLVDLWCLGQCREENAPALRALDLYLKEKLVTWLSPAALTLHQITWDDPASLLEKIVAYEVCGRLPVHLVWCSMNCYYGVPTDGFEFNYLGCASNQESDRLEEKIGHWPPMLWVLPSSNTR